VAKNTICLWYDKEAEAAARFFRQTTAQTQSGTSRRIGKSEIAVQTHRLELFGVDVAAEATI
jgi:predicted 3-demethylubiquinone-9 3-methyltransferase (glyoxalase superfamily)